MTCSARYSTAWASTGRPTWTSSATSGQWQLLGEPGYHGNPLRAHEPVHACYGFRPEHYERWLTMFTEAVDEHLSGPLAEAAKVRSAKMARALRRLLDGHDGRGHAPALISAPAE